MQRVIIALAIVVVREVAEYIFDYFNDDDVDELDAADQEDGK